MSVLVTGATGFLGGALVDRLVARGLDRGVRCLARPGARTARLERAGVAIVRGSLSSVEAADAALGDASLIYHLAAAGSGGAADLVASTVVSSKNLLEAIARRARRPKVLLVSSFSVYGVAGLPRGAVVDESTPLEPHPERRDPYALSKLRQEQLFWEYAGRLGLELVVVRPGVIYGPGGTAISGRVGLSLGGVFLFLGGDNVLPLTYVDNCADAIIDAAAAPKALGQAYNVVDDDLPTCAEFLRRYQAAVRPVRTLPIPYPAARALSWLCERYHVASRGQLPAFFTPYRTASSWGGNRFDNGKLKALGWRPAVTTDEGMARTFAHLAGKG